MKKISVLLLILSLAFVATPALAGEHGGEHGGSNMYLDQMQTTLVRGIKNVVGAVAEVPMTIQEYHEGTGRPVIRHLAGTVDGLFRMVVRFGSGAWDLVAALIPGHQDGMPVDPETLF
ncbi:MAG: hypothetical protein Q8R76_09205 [Candidatus Omnitrophota bacterium]|nr:hypothetical protein [Candidatus Omnitrophota bacterium]